MFICLLYVSSINNVMSKFSTVLVCNSRIQQSLPQIVKENSQVQIQCSHEDKTRPFMLWYQQRDHGQPVIFIGYEYGTKAQIYGGPFEEQFKMKRENSLTGILTVLSANPSHSAVYFCAITDHSDVVGGLSFTKTPQCMLSNEQNHHTVLSKNDLL
uniref:Immunoglobulin domain-containing protein n=1 Tax=Poecilia mexicana TaxID=48701 RepID=A0A3B3Y973_9TELE